MGRKYTRVEISHGKRKVSDVLAFIDSGADLSIMGTNLMEKLGIENIIYERSWIASDGDKLYSPIVEVGIKAYDDRSPVELDEVIVDDLPIDEESGEEIILGLDYLQKGKKTLVFDD